MNAAARPPLHADLKRMAIIAPSWVGDTVMATPVFRAVRQHCPDAHITVFGRPGLDDILAGLPYIDACRTLTMSGLFGPRRASRVLGKVNPDAVLLLPNSFRSALSVRLSSAPVRVGYGRDGRGWLLTHAYDVQKSAEPTSTVLYYARLAELACGVESIETKLELAVTDAEREDAAPLLDALGSSFVILNPGGNKDAKRWPADRFARIAEHITREHGRAVAVSGSPGERDLLNSIVDDAATEVINLSARGTTLRTLKAVMERADLLITNDTGPRHIAAALGTPIVSLFGPTDARWTTLTDVNERLVVSEPFLPSELTADDYPAACAIDRIPVSDVVCIVDSMLA